MPLAEQSGGPRQSNKRNPAMPRSKPPRKKKPAARRKRQAQPAVPPLPDRRTMERALSGLAAGQRNDALHAAQEFMYDAWESPSRRRRIALARKALARSPLCADAYVLLAEETAKDLGQAIDLYARGVEAGELALGSDTFERDVGHFWGLLETRPYMRARAGLADALRALGEREAAIAHYRDMLRLNPNDNQGIRYLLARCLQDMERHDELDTLLDDHSEDVSAAWTYTRTLATFRRTGDTEESRRLLATAIRWNRHVPTFLLGRPKLPRSAPDYITFGGEDEALQYVGDFGAGWERTPGAVAWLRDTTTRLPDAEDERGEP